jgi:hypothetical protein
MSEKTIYVCNCCGVSSDKMRFRMALEKNELGHYSRILFNHDPKLRFDMDYDFCSKECFKQFWNNIIDAIKD